MQTDQAAEPDRDQRCRSTTPTIFSDASRIDARTVSELISAAVIGAQIGDGELSHHWASAQDTPAETAILSAWTSTPRSMASSSLSGRSLPLSATGEGLQQPANPGRYCASARVAVAVVDGARSMTLILPH